MKEDRKEKGHKPEPWAPQVSRGLEMRKNRTGGCREAVPGERGREEGRCPEGQDPAGSKRDARRPHLRLPTPTPRRFLSLEMTLTQTKALLLGRDRSE